MDTKALTLRLPEDLWEKLKLLALKQRRPLTEILVEAAQEYIKSHKKVAA